MSSVRAFQCSYSVCLRNKEDSEKAVNAYVDEWRTKKPAKFTCFYDTETLDTVIVQKMYSTSDVVHRCVLCAARLIGFRAAITSLRSVRLSVGPSVIFVVCAETVSATTWVLKAYASHNAPRRAAIYELVSG